MPFMYNACFEVPCIKYSVVAVSDNRRQPKKHKKKRDRDRQRDESVERLAAEIAQEHQEMMASISTK